MIMFKNVFFLSRDAINKTLQLLKRLFYLFFERGGEEGDGKGRAGKGLLKVPELNFALR